MDKHVDGTTELSLWVWVVYYLNKRHEFNKEIQILVSREIIMLNSKIRDQFLISSETDPWGTYQYFGNEILRQIIMPLISKKK
jgi:hypothetical protein